MSDLPPREITDRPGEAATAAGWRHRRSVHLAAAVLCLMLVMAGAAPAGPATNAWPDEISGMAQLPDGRLLLVDDEERTGAFLLHLADLADPTQRPVRHPLPTRLDDLEAATIDSSGNIYLLTSHSPTKKGKVRADRRRLARLAAGWADGGDGAAGGPADGSTQPPITLVSDLLTRLPAAGAGDRSYNLEGLAWYPAGDRLLIGARQPLNEGRALIFAIGPAPALLAGGPVSSAIYELDLGGRGIRGLEYDPWRRGCLILAGPSGGGPRRQADGSANQRDYAVYLWRAEIGVANPAPPELIELEVAGLEQLKQPEAICPGGPVDAHGIGPLIIATEGRVPGGTPLVKLQARPLRATEER